MARRKTTARRYTNEQRREILRRVKAGETQTAIAAGTGIRGQITQRIALSEC